MRVRLYRVAAILALVGLSGTVGAGVASATSPAGAKTARERQMRAVVHEWSARLNAGDNDGVARLFALPAVLAQGSLALRLDTRAQIAEWHSGLPCAGHVVSIAIHGQDAIVVFRLGDRGATKCDAPGTLAAARFLIVRGKIALWQQVPVPAKQVPQGGLAS